MFTARHFEKTAQVLATIEDDELRYQQARIWVLVFEDDNRAFKADMFTRRVEFLHLHRDEFNLLTEIDPEADRS